MKSSSSKLRSPLSSSPNSSSSPSPPHNHYIQTQQQQQSHYLPHHHQQQSQLQHQPLQVLSPSQTQILQPSTRHQQVLQPKQHLSQSQPHQQQPQFQQNINSSHSHSINSSSPSRHPLQQSQCGVSLSSNNSHPNNPNNLSSHSHNAQIQQQQLQQQSSHSSSSSSSAPSHHHQIQHQQSTSSTSTTTSRNQQNQQQQQLQQQQQNNTTKESAEEKSYEFLQHVGSGAYGQVFKARDPNRDGSFVAIKQIKIRGRHYEAGMPMAAVREIALLKQLEKMEHPNIVRLLDVHHQRTVQGDICLSLVFEFIDQDLNSYLERCPPPGLGPDRIRDLMIQMVNGIDFLHSNRIVHRDLKPQNILVTRSGIVKLADFGLARIYASDMVLTSVVVTLYYRAPEVLLTGQYATSVDMWSCGCIFAELFIRRPLFKGTSEGDQLKKIFDVIGLPDLSQWPESAALLWASFRQSLPPPIDHIVPGLDRQAKDLLEKLLIFQPEQRIIAKDALHHPFFPR